MRTQSPQVLTDSQIKQLADVRSRLREYMSVSEEAARQAGIEPQQYYLMVTLRGLPDGVKPTITNVANRLYIRHHSAVELVNRAVERGLVERSRSEDDKREVILALTPAGQALVEQLALTHFTHLRREGQALVDSINLVLSQAE